MRRRRRTRRTSNEGYHALRGAAILTGRGAKYGARKLYGAGRWGGYKLKEAYKKMKEREKAKHAKELEEKIEHEAWEATYKRGEKPRYMFG